MLHLPPLDQVYETNNLTRGETETNGAVMFSSLATTIFFFLIYVTKVVKARVASWQITMNVKEQSATYIAHKSLYLASGGLEASSDLDRISPRIYTYKYM